MSLSEDKRIRIQKGLPMSQIREEFERAFSEFGVKPEDSYVGWERAIWAAKWIAQRIQKDALTIFNDPTAAAYIQEILKDLSQ